MRVIGIILSFARRLKVARPDDFSAAFKIARGKVPQDVDLEI